MKPITACGPPNAATISGIVTNGPMPHIWLMLMAVAWKRPTRRTKPPVGGGLEADYRTWGLLGLTGRWAYGQRLRLARRRLTGR